MANLSTPFSTVTFTAGHRYAVTLLPTDVTPAGPSYEPRPAGHIASLLTDLVFARYPDGRPVHPFRRFFD